MTSFVPRLLMFPARLERFRHDYPDGFIISSVRHPAGWYASVIKHKHDQYGSLERILDFWMGSTRAIVRAKQHLGDRFIPIDFESLVADPATFVSRSADGPACPGARPQPAEVQRHPSRIEQPLRERERCRSRCQSQVPGCLADRQH